MTKYKITFELETEEATNYGELMQLFRDAFGEFWQRRNTPEEYVQRKLAWFGHNNKAKKIQEVEHRNRLAQDICRDIHKADVWEKVE